MRLICSKRDCYDYLLVSRDQRDRVYKRNPSLMMDLVKETYFTPHSKTRNFHQLPTLDSTLYLQRLLTSYYRMLDSRVALARFDRLHVIVVGTRLFLVVKRDLNKSVDNVTSFIKDKSHDLQTLAAFIRSAADVGPIVGVTYYNRNEFTPYIPEMHSLVKTLGLTNEEIAQEIENAMIEDNPDPTLPNVSDKDRIVQHGFDLKTSFRGK